MHLTNDSNLKRNRLCIVPVHTYKFFLVLMLMFCVVLVNLYLFIVETANYHVPKA